MEIHPATTSTK